MNQATTDSCGLYKLGHLADITQAAEEIVERAIEVAHRSPTSGGRYGEFPLPDNVKSLLKESAFSQRDVLFDLELEITKVLQERGFGQAHFKIKGWFKKRVSFYNL